MLRIYTFGGLRIERRGQPVQLSPRRARDLLAYLITSRDRSNPRSVLAGALWPEAVSSTGFRWDLLRDEGDGDGPERLAAQYLRANTDPSDRYVQSLPGSGRHRLEPGATGFTNLAIAGDWTACGLDAGCVEAATRSGVQAARAILDGSVRAADASSGRDDTQVDGAA